MKKGVKIAGFGCLGIVVLFVLLILGGALAGSKDDEVEKVEETKVVEEVVEPKEVLTVNIDTLLDEFDTNEVRAKDKYENKIIKTTGEVGIAEDGWSDKDYFITVRGTDDWTFDSVHCPLTKDEILTLDEGEQITIQGDFNSLTLGDIFLKPCKIVK